jgi:DNA-binding MarR family transcriptional regulator
LIRRCLQQTEANMAGEIGPYDLTIRQYATLLVICFHPRIGESGLTRLLGYESSNAALVVRLLAAKDMITSDSLRERGRRRYRATSLGISTIAAIEPEMTRAEVSLVAEMDAAAIARLQKMLGTIIAALDPLMRAPLILFREIVSEPGWPTPLQPHLSIDISLATPASE